MVRMALRGLFARKLRTRADGLRRRDRRRVRRRARSSSPTRSTRRSPTCSSACRRASTSTSRPSSPSRATSAAASSRCPHGHAREGRGGARRRGGRGALRDQSSRSSTRSASGSAATARRRSCSPPTRSASTRSPTSRAARPSEPGQVTLDEATADREGFEVGDEILVGGREPAHELRDLRHHEASATRSSIGIQSLNMPLAEVQRIAAASPARSPRSSPRPRAARARSSSRPRSARRSAATARRAHRQGAGGGVRLRHHRLARLPQDRAARVRRRRGARRRLPDLQHVRGHGRAALARVRAAAHARRVAPPGAQLGRRRDAA